MSLEIVAGSSGAGKSYTIYQELIRESITHPERDYIVIVPEQFTMQTQKDLVTMHPRHGLLNVDVLSFNRLAWRVFGETGGDTRPVLEDLGKSLVLQRVVTGCAKDLGVLAGTMKKQGSVEEMKSLISELLQYQVKPEDLGQWLEKNRDKGGLLPKKIADVQMIYGRFMDYLRSRYLTTEEVPELLSDVIGDSSFVRGSTVVMDGFTGFTPVQLQVVQKLLSLCRKVTVAVTADPDTDLMKKGGRHHLFYMSRRMTQQLVKLADDAHCEVLPIRRIRENARFAGNEPLIFLEKNILRSRKTRFRGKQDSVRVRSASDPSEEIRYVTAEILRMVRDDGYRWKDFAVVSGNTETYGRECARQFAAEGIPYFLDQKKSVLENPLVEFIRASLDLIVRGFSYESVFRFLRSPLVDFTPEEVDRMENYVLALGIRGWKKYSERWVRIPRNGDPEEIGELNGLRERFCDLLGEFTEDMRKRNVPLVYKAETLYRFIVKNDLQQKIENLADRFEKEKDAARAKEYRQIYQEVMSVLDRMVEILGDDRMGNAAFQKLLDAGFAESTIGLIPPGEDQVMVGDITRTRLKKIRVMFLVGVNEGVVPAAAKPEGLLSDSDRSALADGRIRLAPDAREELASQRFYLYLATTKAGDRLYLSYSRMSASGETLTPSYLIRTVCDLFPDLRVETEETGMHQLETSEGVLRLLLDGVRNTGGDTDRAVFAGVASENPEMFRHLADAALMRNMTDGIGEKTARALYGAKSRQSASRLETFASCAFRHFLQYGLKLKEREEYLFSGADFGMIVHEALQRFSERLIRERRSLSELSDADRERFTDEAFDSIVHDYGNTILHSSSRNAYEISRIRRILKRTTWALQKQMEAGSFHLEDAERVFFMNDLESMRIRSGENSEVRLTGKIDRIDVCDDEQDRYVRIIDYKTGSTTFSVSELYYGLQIQLMLYMDAAMEFEQRENPGKQIKPAGLFYYHVEDPFTDPEKPGTKEEQILKKLKLDGLAPGDAHTLALLDRSLGEPKSGSLVIHAERKKDGSLHERSKTATDGEFQALRAYVRRKTGELARRMQAGETAANPYRSGGRDACTYCPYAGACGYDERIPGYRHRLLKAVTIDDIVREEKESSGADK